MQDLVTMPKHTDIHDEGKPDPKKEAREIVNLILPDSLMIALAALMIPVILIPLLLDIHSSIAVTLRVIDYIILCVFIIEYLAKLILAPNILKHFLAPWHLLDLLILVIPFINFLPFITHQLASYSRTLRLLRIIRVVVVGGRTMDRRAQLITPTIITETARSPLSIQVIDGTLEDTFEDVSIDQLKVYMDSPAPTWADISCLSESDLDQISTILNIPKILLESELTDESYPRADYFEDNSMIFAKIADIQVSHKDLPLLSINRTGLLVICHGPNIITISKTKTELFHHIIEQAKKMSNPDDPIIVTILYTILKFILQRDKQTITALEQELIRLENISPKKRPANFLETTFHLRKEINPLVPSLLHLKEIVFAITSKRILLEGFSERHENIFNILAEEATYLYETASDARDNLQSLVDLYINTTSFQTNKVMRIIAVITSLGIIPAVLGLLGSNIIGNPWDIDLWQVYALLAGILLVMGWIFYRLGWFK